MRQLVCLLLLVCFSSVSFASDIPVFFGEEVVVTASRRIQPASEPSSPVKVITEEDINKSGAKTAADALRAISSVNIKSTGGLGGISTLRLRSASSSQVLLLLNGQKINSALLGVFDLNDIPVSNIKKIEVVEDSLSSIYGADAVGGVINIITRSHDERPVSVSVNYGSFGEIGLSGAAGGTIYGLGYYMSLDDIRSDGFRQNSDYRNRGYSIAIDWGGTASLKYDVLSSERGNPGVPSSDDDPWSASTPSDRQKDFYGNLVLGLQGEHFGSKSKLTLFETVQDQNVHYVDSFSGLFNDDRYFSRIYGSEYQNIYRFSSSVLTSGVEWKRSAGISSKAGAHDVDNSSAYFSLDSGPGLPMAANIGARYDSSPVWGGVVNPRAGMVVNIPGGAVLRYSVSQAFRAPTINELYWREPSWGMFGNPDLRPEKSRSFNAVLERAFGGDLVSIGYYSNRIEDMISWTETSPWVWQPENINAARIEGISLGAKKEITAGLALYADYNTENVTDTASGLFVPYSPVYKFNAGIEIIERGLSIRLNSRDVSKVYTDTANTKTLPAYRVVDLVASKKAGLLNVRASLLNIFDEKYFESTGYSQVDWQERGYPMPGRRFEVRLSY